MLILLSACAGPGSDDLYGTRPLTNKGAPEFTAQNDGGGDRTREDLLGHATAMWFYPAANTGG